MSRYGEPKTYPDDPSDTPPRSNTPPATQPGQPDAPFQMAATGVVLPSVYGTVRIAGNLVERYIGNFQAPTTAWQAGATAWAASTAVVLGDLRTNVGNIYICSQAGTTAGSGGPTGNGTAIADGTAKWDYTRFGYRHLCAFGYCEGQIFGARKAWQDKNSFSAYTSIPHESTFITLQLGTPSGGRTPAWPFFPGPAGGINDVYGNTAVLWVYANTGGGADLPNSSLEIQGIFCTGSPDDVNPVDIAIDLLTHARRGAQLPSARVDTTSTGAGAASWRTYCTAMNFLVSWAIDAQTSALSLLKVLLNATNTDAVWTNRPDGLGGMFKFVPLGDQAITAHAVTYTPNTTPAYSLGPDDLLAPIDIDVTPPTDTYNSWPVEYIDRAGDYKTITVDDPDMSDVDQRGLVRANTTSLPLVMDPTAAVALSRIKAQRSLQVRNTYTVKASWRFLLAEPTDLLAVTESVLGLSNQLMRVIAWEEDQGGDGAITFTCEDFPTGAGNAPGYLPQTGDGFKPAVEPALTVFQALPGQVQASSSPDSSSTRAGNVDNIWPNPTSEISPPDGVDLTAPEWKGRVNLGAGAFAGAWVRSPGVGANLKIDYLVPAAPGDTYYMQAQVKAAVAAANKGGFVKITAVDANLTALGSASSSENDTTSYATASISFAMPAGTTQVRFSLVNGSDASAQAYFDAIYVRRSIDLALFPTEPWAARRYFAMTQVLINGAGTTASYQTGYGTFGFDISTPPALVQVGVEPQKRLRLTFLTPPNGVGPSTVKQVVFTQRNPNGLIPLTNPDWRLLEVGWNLANRQLDFFLYYTDWGGGAPTDIGPAAWSNVDGANGSVWDVMVGFATTTSPFF